jgi:hypothetical protein
VRRTDAYGVPFALDITELVNRNVKFRKAPEKMTDTATSDAAFERPYVLWDVDRDDRLEELRLEQKALAKGKKRKKNHDEAKERRLHGEAAVEDELDELDELQEEAIALRISVQAYVRRLGEMKAAQILELSEDHKEILRYALDRVIPTLKRAETPDGQLEAHAAKLAPELVKRKTKFKELGKQRARRVAAYTVESAKSRLVRRKGEAADDYDVRVRTLVASGRDTVREYLERAIRAGTACQMLLGALFQRDIDAQAARERRRTLPALSDVDPNVDYEAARLERVAHLSLNDVPERVRDAARRQLLTDGQSAALLTAGGAAGTTIVPSKRGAVPSGSERSRLEAMHKRSSRENGRKAQSQILALQSDMREKRAAIATLIESGQNNAAVGAIHAAYDELFRRYKEIDAAGFHADSHALAKEDQDALDVLMREADPEWTPE